MNYILHDNTIKQRFQSVRDAHKHETTQDYVELIADFINEYGSVRTVDIARAMGVAQPTATKIINRLQKDGYVISQPYKDLSLTPKGEHLAHTCKQRHEIVMEFLQVIGVDEKTADIDAEGIEHHVSDATLRAFKNFIEKQK
jgi:DtxR family manganese transport transcriptional regulator